MAGSRRKQTFAISKHTPPTIRNEKGNRTRIITASWMMHVKLIVEMGSGTVSDYKCED
jgi:hypothetical protein